MFVSMLYRKEVAQMTLVLLIVVVVISVYVFTSNLTITTIPTAPTTATDNLPSSTRRSLIEKNHSPSQPHKVLNSHHQKSSSSSATTVILLSIPTTTTTKTASAIAINAATNGVAAATTSTTNPKPIIPSNHHQIKTHTKPTDHGNPAIHIHKPPLPQQQQKQPHTTPNIPHTSSSQYRHIDASVLKHQYIKYSNFTKVLVPSVYNEYEKYGMPPWITNKEIQERLGYSVFLYQKLNASAPNYVRNRGTEGAVFLRYIVDHYDNFPDVAIFIHAIPNDHNPMWWEQIGCIKPTANYININFRKIIRNSAFGTEGKEDIGTWVEQCWRDVLKIVWNVNTTSDILPPTHPIEIVFSCCQQFIISRKMVLKRPLSVWKALLKIINEQDVCHIGEPEYDSLYMYHKMKKHYGPEQSTFTPPNAPIDNFGRIVQGGAMEHLAHVIYGGVDLQMEMPNMEEICEHYEAGCPFSPCKHQK